MCGLSLSYKIGDHQRFRNENALSSVSPTQWISLKQIAPQVRKRSADIPSASMRQSGRTGAFQGFVVVHPRKWLLLPV